MVWTQLRLFPDCAIHFLLAGFKKPHLAEWNVCKWNIPLPSWCLFFLSMQGCLQSSHGFVLSAAFRHGFSNLCLDLNLFWKLVFQALHSNLILQKCNFGQSSRCDCFMNAGLPFDAEKLTAWVLSLTAENATVLRMLQSPTNSAVRVKKSPWMTG